MRSPTSLSLSLLMISSLFTYVLADFTYWLSPGCENKGRFAYALDEAIWNAGRVAEMIEAKKSQVEEPLKWFFNIKKGTPEATNVQHTFKRISQLRRINDRTKSQLRIYCDNNERYKPVMDDGTLIVPAPTEIDVMRVTKYYDEENDSFIMGSQLHCQVMSVYAHGFHGMQATNDLLRAPRKGHAEDRFAITFCDRFFRSNDNPRRPYTAWDFSRLPDLETQLRVIFTAKPLAFSTITHEFIHVPFLSSHDLNYPIVDERIVAGNGKYGNDKHGVLGLNGYYDWENMKMPGENLAKYEYTIMNPDSYAYMSLVLRLRDNQFRAYSELITRDRDGNRELGVRIRKDTELPLLGRGIVPE